MCHYRTVYKSILILLFSLLIVQPAAWAECQECSEVAKGQIPQQFLDTALKIHPSGVAIWDEGEAIDALKDSEKKCLWVDTRPKSFFNVGTIKDAILLVCDLKGQPVPEDQHGPALTPERLMEAMKKVDADPGNVTVVFFCQGPKCHRSYDAALRAVSEYNMDPMQIVWFRAGYPLLEKYISDNPKLKRKIARYLQGDVLNTY